MDKALEKAMHVFWKKGYEGTSLPDLTKAMGINRPSLYAAFGNKQALFKKVVERYSSGPACYIREAIEKPTVKEVMDTLLRQGIDLLYSPKNPRGCMIVQSALACSDEAEPVKKELAGLRDAGYNALLKRFEKAKADGELSKDAKPADLARYATTIMHGLSIQASSGAKREELDRVVEMVLSGFSKIL